MILLHKNGNGVPVRRPLYILIFQPCILIRHFPFPRFQLPSSYLCVGDDHEPSAEKWRERSRCHLADRLEWAKGIT